MTRLGALTVGLLGGAAAMTADAHAQGDGLRGYAKLGLAYVDVKVVGDMTLGGAPLPGAGIGVAPNETASLEVGYFLTDNIAASLTLTAPMETTNFAGGSITGMGALGTDTFGTSSLTAHYHFNRDGVVQPYFGGGVTYFYVTDTSDGIVSGLSVDDGLGAVAQAGVDFHMHDRWGWYIDYKRAVVETHAGGALGAPITADGDLKISTLQVGLSYAF